MREHRSNWDGKLWSKTYYAEVGKPAIKIILLIESREITVEKQIVNWLLVGILIVSSISLIIVYQQDYIAESHGPRAIPLAIVAGLSAIAVAISQKNKDQE